MGAQDPVMRGKWIELASATFRTPTFLLCGSLKLPWAGTAMPFSGSRISSGALRELPFAGDPKPKTQGCLQHSLGRGETHDLMPRRVLLAMELLRAVRKQLRQGDGQHEAMCRKHEGPWAMGPNLSGWVESSLSHKPPGLMTSARLRAHDIEAPKRSSPRQRTNLDQHRQHRHQPQIAGK